MGKSHTNSGKLFIISAPTGAGKTTLTNLIISRHPHVKRAVTYTTRKPRPGESHGVDYFFVSEPEFLALKDGKQFLETTKYDQSWYGSPKDILDDVENGAFYIIITDWPGAQTISHELRSNHSSINFETIWITVTSNKVLAERLKDRYAHDTVAFERRLQLFDNEIKREEEARFFSHHVTNDNLEETYEKLCLIMELTTMKFEVKTPSLLLFLLAASCFTQFSCSAISISGSSGRTEEEKTSLRADLALRRQKRNERRAQLAGPNRKLGSGTHTAKNSYTGKDIINAVKGFFSRMFGRQSKETKKTTP